MQNLPVAGHVVPPGCWGPPHLLQPPGVIGFWVCLFLGPLGWGWAGARSTTWTLCAAGLLPRVMADWSVLEAMMALALVATSSRVVFSGILRSFSVTSGSRTPMMTARVMMRSRVSGVRRHLLAVNLSAAR